MAPPTDEEVRQRIIKHMNADHQDSIARYIEHQHSASRYTARNATLTDITTANMTIHASGKSYTIPFSPPLKTLAEARDRVITLDKEAVTALGRHPISVKTYQAPYGPWLVIFLAALGTLILLARREFTAPGSVVDSLVPPFARFVTRVRLVVLVPMVGIHAAEAVYMTSVLRRHSVPLFSEVWFKWVVSCFVEGFGSFYRLKQIVAKQEAKLKSAKH